MFEPEQLQNVYQQKWRNCC